MAKRGLDQIKMLDLGKTGKVEKVGKRQCGLCGKTKKLTRTAATTGFVTTKTNIGCSHLLIIAVVEIIDATPFAAPISPKSTKVHGKIVKSAPRALRPKCMSITALMNTISRSWRIHLSTSQRDVWSAIGSLGWAMMVIPMDPMAMPATNVAIRNSEMRFEDSDGLIRSINHGYSACKSCSTHAAS
jgi:uncharacterized protein (UPF0212 family)